MDRQKEFKKLGLIVVIFAGCFFLPVGLARFDGAVLEALHMVKDYAREHVLLCLVPAFFIAGAISVFVRQGAVMKYLGAGANKVLAYGVASVSGSILAVCSCTVLPLFAGIYRMGAGLGPAVAFLYSGPAINVMAMILTARVLGIRLGIARAVGAVVLGIVVGILMEVIFRADGKKKAAGAEMAIPKEGSRRSGWQELLYFGSMVGILVFANWSQGVRESGIWSAVYSVKWWISGGLLVGLVLMLVSWFEKKELGEWVGASWDFTKQILPLLLAGVLLAGAFLGRPGHEGLIRSDWVAWAVGGESVGANLAASVAGAFMYFATLTEVPILSGLMGAGMGKGPALALLLAGPALSLPNMLVIRSVLGTIKTLVYVLLVVGTAALSGIIYGSFF